MSSAALRRSEGRRLVRPWISFRRAVGVGIWPVVLGPSKSSGRVPYLNRGFWVIVRNVLGEV